MILLRLFRLSKKLKNWLNNFITEMFYQVEKKNKHI